MLLAGVKSVEVRKYPLAPAKGSRQFCLPQEELFIIETKQKGPALVGSATLPAATITAHIIGTVTFASSTRYEDVEAFQKDQARHRIARQRS